VCERIDANPEQVAPKPACLGAAMTSRATPAGAVPIVPADVEAAFERTSGYVRSTPVVEVEPGALETSGHIVLKLEQLQHTGSYKPRGAFNRILGQQVPSAGVVAASGGNFGAAVAYAASVLGHVAELFVPESTPATKVDRLHAFGGSVVVTGGFYADALGEAERRGRETGALWMHAFDQHEMVAGNGTVARELETQCPGLDTLLVAVGGGGLIAGIAAWFEGRVRVVGVETTGTASMAAALADDGPVDIDVGGITADALGARRVGRLCFAIAQRLVDRIVVVEDDDVRRAQRELWQRLRLLVEPAGAAAPAALISGAYRPESDERVGVLLCGANFDPRSIDA
jgi:threonine dehydratase